MLIKLKKSLPRSFERVELQKLLARAICNEESDCFLRTAA
jgi:hypothetical protein